MVRKRLDQTDGFPEEGAAVTPEIQEEDGGATRLTRDQLVKKLKKNESGPAEKIALEGMLGIGVPMAFGNITLDVPSLTARALSKALRLINKISETEKNGAMTEESIRDMCEVIHMALVRNYPDLTVDEVLDLVDLENLQPVFRQVLQVSNITLEKNAGRTAK